MAINYKIMVMTVKTIVMSIKTVVMTIETILMIQPRGQAFPFCGGKTLVGDGHVSYRKLIA
jgi:hypothetical protein